MKTVFNVDNEPLPRNIDEDQILNADGGCIIIFDPDDQSGLRAFITVSVDRVGQRLDSIGALHEQSGDEKDPYVKIPHGQMPFQNC